MHVQQSISVIRQKDLKEAYKSLLKTKKECKMKLKDITFHSECAAKDQDMTLINQAEKTTTAACGTAKGEAALVMEQVFQYTPITLWRRLGNPRPRLCQST